MINLLLITGAAGGLGQVLRQRLAPLANSLRLSDLAPIGAARVNEELRQCDLADEGAVYDMLADVDAVVHLGGISVEASFASIMSANILGTFNLYEGARKRGIKRIVFASSNHVTGFYAHADKIDLPRGPVCHPWFFRCVKTGQRTINNE